MADTTPTEAELLADAVLRAAGSSLCHYSMAKTRAEIIAAAQRGIDMARADLVAALNVIKAEAPNITHGSVHLRERAKNSIIAWADAALSAVRK